MKAGPQQAQFEPVQGKIVKFSDVHGVDEAKNVRHASFRISFGHDDKLDHLGTARSRRLSEGSHDLHNSWR
jgi:hypothetical protein